MTDIQHQIAFLHYMEHRGSLSDRAVERGDMAVASIAFSLKIGYTPISKRVQQDLSLLLSLVEEHTTQ